MVTYKEVSEYLFNLPDDTSQDDHVPLLQKKFNLTEKEADKLVSRYMDDFIIW